MAGLKKILIISYVYPPAGGGGSPRLVRWTKAIADAGFHPVVLTVKDVFGMGQDRSLLKEVEQTATIEKDKLSRS